MTPTPLITKLIHLQFVMEELELLLFNIDGSHHVFVLEVWRNPEAFAEDIERALTADKADQVVTACPGFL